MRYQNNSCAQQQQGRSRRQEKRDTKLLGGGGGLINVTRVRTAFRGRGFLSAAPLTTFAARDIEDIADGVFLL